jgi:HEAT repeat protein
MEPGVALLRKDDWPQVRAAAALALVVGKRSAHEKKSVASALLRRLRRDGDPKVRASIARAFSQVGGEDVVLALRRAFEKDESHFVRAQAALSLGALCDAGSLEELTRAAHQLAAAPMGDGPIVVGLAAVTALVQIGPADLDQRLAPTLSKKVSGVLRTQVKRRVEARKTRAGSCGTPGES